MAVSPARGVERPRRLALEPPAGPLWPGFRTACGVAGVSPWRGSKEASARRSWNQACPPRSHRVLGTGRLMGAVMASVARRHQQLTAEITQLDAALATLVNRAAPVGFLAKQGVAI